MAIQEPSALQKADDIPMIQPLKRVF